MPSQTPTRILGHLSLHRARGTATCQPTRRICRPTRRKSNGQLPTRSRQRSSKVSFVRVFPDLPWLQCVLLDPSVWMVASEQAEPAHHQLVFVPSGEVHRLWALNHTLLRLQPRPPKVRRSGRFRNPRSMTRITAMALGPAA